MNLATAYIIVLLTGTAGILLFRGKGQAMFLSLVILLLAWISGVPAWRALNGEAMEWYLAGNMVTGEIPLRMDGLSAWFILITSFVFLTGIVYGFHYLKKDTTERHNLTIHRIAFLLLYGTLISLTVIQNSLVFLIAWEIMTLSAFIAVLYEHGKEETSRAGINFLIQSHISVLFLMTGFIFSVIKTGSYDFASIPTSATGSGFVPLALMLCFFVGFGIKAGFVPFHTWLPYAHPAAPAHISGIMSGVMIKIGIFGILRMLLLIPVNYMVAGAFLITVSLGSGFYGVMLAIVQHNLKKLLAYHSVENIGIIGLGIGIGCIGLGTGNQMVAFLGFAGALLHSLNHALFKSLLFYVAGIVYQATHTLNVEHLGGLIRKMPLSATLFLVAAVAICGIPPLNGFVSEFLIYSGLYRYMVIAPLVPSVLSLLTILGLVLIGGLAILCFTKAFGIVFLGTPRKTFDHEVIEASSGHLVPLFLTVLPIAGIGLFPHVFVQMVTVPAGLFTGSGTFLLLPELDEVNSIMKSVSVAVWGTVLLTLFIWGIRYLAIRKRAYRNADQKSAAVPTWGCGFVAPSPKMQYTASSFVRTYRKLNGPILLFSKKENSIRGIFPEGGNYESHSHDKIEKWLIDKPLEVLRKFMERFLFFQNGRLQSYLLYGILFILALIIVPLILEKAGLFIQYISQP
jgi:formate hydrogenlyase subunit 3/multisubunit Na+/H+ antiporter MnhD subunit